MRPLPETLLACPLARTTRTGALARRPSLVVNEVSQPVELAIAAFVSIARLLRREGCPLREERLLDEGLYRRLEGIAFRLPPVNRQEGES